MFADFFIILPELNCYIPPRHVDTSLGDGIHLTILFLESEQYQSPQSLDQIRGKPHYIQLILIMHYIHRPISFWWVTNVCRPGLSLDKAKLCGGGTPDSYGTATSSFNRIFEPRRHQPKNKSRAAPLLVVVRLPHHTHHTRRPERESLPLHLTGLAVAPHVGHCRYVIHGLMDVRSHVLSGSDMPIPVS